MEHIINNDAIMNVSMVTNKQGMHELKQLYKHP